MSQVLTFMGSRSANVALALVHFGLAATVATTLGDNNPSIQKPTVFFLDPRGGTGSANVDIKWLLVAFTVITGLFHLMYAYQGFAGQMRYIEYAITASLMIAIIQLLSGEDDGTVLATVFGLIATTMLLGYVQDEKLSNPGMSTAAFWFGWVPYIFAWAVVIIRFLNSIEESDQNVPGFVKAIIWIELAVFSCFALTQYYYVVRPGAVFNLERYDGAYNTLSILAKGLLVGFAYFGLRGIDNASIEP